MSRPLLFGRNADGNVGLSVDDMVGKHAHVLGQSASGKTRWLIGLVCQLIMRGFPVFVIDFKEDLFRAIADFCCHRGLAKRTVVVDPEDGMSQEGQVPGINPLDEDVAPDLAAAMTKFCLKQLFGQEKEISPWLDDTANLALNALSHGRNGQAFTIFEAAAVANFEDSRFREALLSQANDPFLRQRFSEMSAFDVRRLAEMWNPLLNRLAGLRYNKSLAAIFGSAETTIDFDSLLADAGVFLLRAYHPGFSPTDLRFLATTVFQKIKAATFRRPVGQRNKPAFVIIDEAQQLAQAGGGEELADFLERGRSYGVHLILSHQFPRQLVPSDSPSDRRVLDSVLSQTAIKVYFRQARRDVEEYGLWGEVFGDELEDGTHAVKDEIWQRSFAPKTEWVDVESETWGDSHGGSESRTEGYSDAYCEGEGYTYSEEEGYSDAETETDSYCYGESESDTEGHDSGTSSTDGWSHSQGESRSSSYGETDGYSEDEGYSDAYGESETDSEIETESESYGQAAAFGKQHARLQGQSETFSEMSSTSSMDSTGSSSVASSGASEAVGYLDDMLGMVPTGSVTHVTGANESSVDSSGSASGYTDAEGYAKGTHEAEIEGESASLSMSRGSATARGRGNSRGQSRTQTQSVGAGQSHADNWSESSGEDYSDTESGSKTHSESENNSHTDGTSESWTQGTSRSHTDTHSAGESWSENNSQTHTDSESETHGTNWSESHQQSRSRVPITEHDEYMALSSRTYYTSEEVKDRLINRLAFQQRRQFVLKFDDLPAVSLRTADVELARVLPRQRRRFKARLYQRYTRVVSDVLEQLQQRVSRYLSAHQPPPGSPLEVEGEPPSDTRCELVRFDQSETEVLG